MSEEQQSSSGFSWFVAGLGFGALLGVLCAPKSGREVREDVVNRARDGAEYLKERSRDTADQVAALVEKGKSRANDYVDQGKEYIDRGRAQVEQAVDQGREFVHRQADRVADAVDSGKQAYDEAAPADLPTPSGIAG